MGENMITGSNNIIKRDNAILNSVVFDIEGNNNFIIIQPGCVLNCVKFYIRGNNHLVTINKDCTFNCSGITWNIYIEDNNSSLTIDHSSTFHDIHLALTEGGSIIIGSNCLLSSDIDIRTGDSHSIISSETGKRINYARNVDIGSHVWICAHVSILKGVVIPDNSVVATRSVVSRRFKTEGIIIGGNPAVQLMAGINWKHERI
jgi:acetyltransferase-like isoleucine patch superfamily enzyme